MLPCLWLWRSLERSFQQQLGVTMKINRLTVKFLSLIALISMCTKANAQVAYYVDEVANEARISFDNGATWQNVANTCKTIKYTDLDGRARISQNYGQTWQWVDTSAAKILNDDSNPSIDLVECYWKEGRMEIDFNNNDADYIVTGLTGAVFARGQLSNHAVLDLPGWSVYLVSVFQGSSVITFKILAY